MKLNGANVLRFSFSGKNTNGHILNKLKHALVSQGHVGLSVCLILAMH